MENEDELEEDELEVAEENPDCADSLDEEAEAALILFIREVEVLELAPLYNLLDVVEACREEELLEDDPPAPEYQVQICPGLEECRLLMHIFHAALGLECRT